jgi:hypothetical protein
MLPSFFKEEMFALQARTGVVALVEPKVGAANGTRTTRPDGATGFTTPVSAKAETSPPF